MDRSYYILRCETKIHPHLMTTLVEANLTLDDAKQVCLDRIIREYKTVSSVEMHIHEEKAFRENKERKEGYFIIRHEQDSDDLIECLSVIQVSSGVDPGWLYNGQKLIETTLVTLVVRAEEAREEKPREG